MLQNFRMLIMTAKPNPTSTGVYTYYSESGDGVIWTTSDIKEALDKYKKLLSTYTTSEMFLVDMVDTEITISDRDYSDVVIEVPEEAVEVVVNDGNAFKVVVNPVDSLKNYAWVNVDSDIASSVATLLENYGLTDVKVTADNGIEATNPTGKAITGSSIICKGLFRAYNKNERSDKYISSSFIIDIK